MTQDERREYLIQYLLKEEVRFVRQSIPTDKQGQENLLRSLMNIRPPRPVSGEFLKIQDEYLTERNRERGITDIDTLAPVKSDSRLYIWHVATAIFFYKFRKIICKSFTTHTYSGSC